MNHYSQIVTEKATPKIHNLCGDAFSPLWQIVSMENQEKNGGPNYLKQWREYRKLSQGELAKRVDTNANMILYLETGERGLSAKWLRRLSVALDTTPGMILSHDPTELDSDIIDIWSHADKRTRQQIGSLVKAIVKTGTDN
jgi:transcriptional regulator with XRE-family HTH domain